MKNRWIPRLNLIIALSLSLSMIIPITGCKKRTQLLNEKPMVVIDADDAIKQLANAEENYGYENALSELTEKSTNTIDGDNYYRLQQNYKGIPVYGRTVVCSTDEDGNVTSFTGNVQDITTEINLTPTITTEQARQSIQTYSTEILKLQNSESITIELRPRSTQAIRFVPGRLRR